MSAMQLDTRMDELKAEETSIREAREAIADRRADLARHKARA